MRAGPGAEAAAKFVFENVEQVSVGTGEVLTFPAAQIRNLDPQKYRREADPEI